MHWWDGASSIVAGRTKINKGCSHTQKPQSCASVHAVLCLWVEHWVYWRPRLVVAELSVVPARRPIITTPKLSLFSSFSHDFLAMILTACDMCMSTGFRRFCWRVDNSLVVRRDELTILSLRFCFFWFYSTLSSFLLISTLRFKKKTKTPYSCRYLCEILADFRNSFTARLGTEFATKHYGLHAVVQRCL